MRVENALNRHLESSLQKHEEERDGHGRDQHQTDNESTNHTSAYFSLDQVSGFLFCDFDHIKYRKEIIIINICN